MSKVSKSSTNTEMSPIELNKFLSQKAILLNAYDNLVVNLRRRKLSGSHSCAKATIEILRSCVSTALYYHSLRILPSLINVFYLLYKAGTIEIPFHRTYATDSQSNWPWSNECCTFRIDNWKYYSQDFEINQRRTSQRHG